MEQIKKLLEQISIINKKNAEILDATGGRFNMFRICGVNHYENTHSAIIAEFLNPNGSHGLKSKLLECFLETLGDRLEIKNFDCANARVITESSTHDGRIDILIEDSQKRTLIIENKIYAGNQEKQLERYNKFAEGKYNERNYQILYLTLYGTEYKTTDSELKDRIKLISHKIDIINWLEKCVGIAVRYPMVRETIIQYINHLKQLTHQDMDTKNKEEIINMIVGDKQLIESADYVYSIWHECHRKIFTNVMDNVKKIAKELGLEDPYFDINDLIGPKGTSISLFKEGWNNYCIFFEFCEGYELHVGVYTKDGSWDDHDSSNQSLKRYLSNLKIKSYAPCEDAWAWGIKWDSLSLSEIPAKLSYDAIKEAVEIIVQKLDDFFKA